jgi:hypothetical protein
MIQTRPAMPSATATSPRRFHIPGPLESHPARRESSEIAHGATPWASGTPSAHTSMNAVRRETVRARCLAVTCPWVAPGLRVTSPICQPLLPVSDHRNSILT